MNRKTIIILVLALSLTLVACDAKTYDEGYSDGYADAKADMAYQLEEEFFDGYDIGYEDGERDGRWLEEDAVEFVREHCEWHPEEALEVIDAYQNNKPFWQDGSPPSNQDYLDAINSLAYFYEYFYGRHYE